LEVPTGSGCWEWFLPGTEMAVVPGDVDMGAVIAYPAAGTVIALDPDIPPEEQKLFFESQPHNDSLRWMLDGRVIGNAGTLLLWTPLPGKHDLSLADEADRILDSIGFEVRS
jgi:penicillin-binding protein 1C